MGILSYDVAGCGHCRMCRGAARWDARNDSVISKGVATVKRVILVLVLIGLALGLGLWLGVRRSGQPYRTERALLSLRFAQTMLPIKIGFLVLLAGVSLVTLGGLGWGIVRWVHRRANTVYADDSGLYPLREERVRGAMVFHDPNRTMGGTTVLRAHGRSVSVQQPLVAGYPALQSQVTGQAQAAQALRAAVSGPAPLPTAQGFPVQLFDRQLSRPLPEVKELPYKVSHIERLLLQDGEPLDGGEMG